MFEPGQRITIPDPDSAGGRVVASFLQIAVDQPVTISDPRFVGGTRKVDQAWVRFEGGERDATTALVPYFDIKAH